MAKLSPPLCLSLPCGTDGGWPSRPSLTSRLTSRRRRRQRCLLHLQDALLACSEAGKLFIHYLAATANDACKDAKRQTVSAEDVLTALEDLDFPELVAPLRAALEGELEGCVCGGWGAACV